MRKNAGVFLSGLLTIALMALAPVVFLLMGAASDGPSLPVEQMRAHFGQNSASCIACHAGVESMHADGDDEIGITCVDCHGGDGEAMDKAGAHVQPRQPEIFASSANPANTYAALNDESPAFIRFMNPGDFRVAGQTCGQCHEDIYSRMLSSIMATGALVPQAAFYNNGVLAARQPVYGEGYMPDGAPAILRATRSNQEEGLIDLDRRSPTSLVEKLEPLARFPIIPALDPFRVLERGNNDAGTRARGTDFKVAGAGLAVQKTRLNDPTLWLMGTNQTAGDYRHSGCTGCHVVYANDRDTLNSGPEIAAFYRAGGRPGYSGSADPRIPKDELGHPVAHRLTVRVPVSQCLTCHHHQGNAALETYVGSMWWDQETEADKILSADVHRDEYMSEADRRALWERNGEFDETQFSDHHGHSWNFRKVYKRDRQGRLLDAGGAIIAEEDPEKFDKAVHLIDIHLERGMHCIDCHTEQDVHGDGRIWGATPDPIEIACIDCHGTASARATLVTSGITGGHDLARRLGGPRTAWGVRQFEIRGDRVIQRSKIYEDLLWNVPQLADIVDPNHPEYNEKAAKAKTMQRDGTWGASTAEPRLLAHTVETMECYTCHSSWNTGCYGCHLALDVNDKLAEKHNEGETSRGQVYYNPQVLRSDNFLLGINGSTKGNKFSPIRSASAVLVTVAARNRQTVVHQQPTISAPGYSGYAFSPNVPHTVRRDEVKQCTDCHVSAQNDNNAWIGSLLGQGTNALNFIGEYAYVAVGEKGIQAVKVTEGDEPQPVIGSYLHSILYPASYGAMMGRGRQLRTAFGVGSSRAQGLAARGEYVFVADGPGGLRIVDRANIDNKNEAQRLVLAQNSGFGEKMRVDTRDATAVALPSSVPMNLDRTALPENLEQPIAASFRYAYVADRQEGLIVVDVNTLHDGDPENNFLERAVTYNPGNRLGGSVDLVIAGNHAYLVSETSGLHVVDISRPLAPQWVAGLSGPDVVQGRTVAVQFRYAFVADGEGVKVIDITNPTQPAAVASVEGLNDAHDVFPARTYLYVAAGRQGLAIVDIENPEAPSLVEAFTAGGVIDDATAVTTGAVNASLFAFVADGRNGLRVVRLIGPPDTPGHFGFSPHPVPRLVATYRTKGPALAVADGTSRDRVVDESGNQIGIMGRLGSRVLGREDRDKLLRHDGALFVVDDEGNVIFR